MILLITASGKGSRFTALGFKTPKSLIKVFNKTLLEYTLDSFKLTANDQLIICVQRAHKVAESLDHSLGLKFAHIKSISWIEFDQFFNGQLLSAMEALEKADINPDDSLVIHNCDTGFEWNSNLLIPSGYFASMPVFTAKGDQWSFGLAHENNKTEAIQVAEKKRISSLASIGFYGFASCNEFLAFASMYISNKQIASIEIYIAPMLNDAIKCKKRIYMPRVSGVKMYGTPSDVCNTFNIKPSALKDMQDEFTY